MHAWPQKIGSKQHKLLSHQSKPFLLRNWHPKLTIFRACVWKFGKNAMLIFHVILLFNHLRIAHNWMSTKYGVQKAELACEICSRPTLSKWMTAGQSENEFASVLKRSINKKTKNNTAKKRNVKTLYKSAQNTTKVSTKTILTWRKRQNAVTRCRWHGRCERLPRLCWIEKAKNTLYPPGESGYF